MGFEKYNIERSRNKLIVECEGCGKKFNPTHSYRKICSRLCRTLLNNKRRNYKIENGERVGVYQLKKYLIEKYGERCFRCNWNEKNPVSKKTPIQLNHIDGDSDNNNIKNLELLCPNCHSLTPNFGNLNKGNGREIRRLRYKKGVSASLV